MNEFGEIEFITVSDIIGEGCYDGRYFVLAVPREDDEGEAMIIKGEFTDDEELFIYTQWEMRKNK